MLFHQLFQFEADLDAILKCKFLLTTIRHLKRSSIQTDLPNYSKE